MPFVSLPTTGRRGEEEVVSRRGDRIEPCSLALMMNKPVHQRQNELLVAFCVWRVEADALPSDTLGREHRCLAEDCHPALPYRQHSALEQALGR